MNEYIEWILEDCKRRGMKATMREIERRLVELVMEEADQNCSRAAKLLKINRPTLVEKRRKFGLVRSWEETH